MSKDLIATLIWLTSEYHLLGSSIDIAARAFSVICFVGLPDFNSPRAEAASRSRSINKLSSSGLLILSLSLLLHALFLLVLLLLCVCGRGPVRDSGCCCGRYCYLLFAYKLPPLLSLFSGFAAGQILRPGGHQARACKAYSHWGRSLLSM